MSKQFDKQNLDRCPLCGAAPNLIDTYQSDYVYHCGSHYLGGQLEHQSSYCYRNSYTIINRFATICGILDARDAEERAILVEKINAYVAAATPTKERLI